MTLQPPHRSRAGLLAALLPFFAACEHGPTGPIVPDAIVMPAVIATVAAGDSATLSATYLVGGASVPSDEGLRWRSLSPWTFSIDSVTGRGLAYWRAGGLVDSAHVVARAGGVEDTTTVIVFPAASRISLTLPQSVVPDRAIPTLVRGWSLESFVSFAPPPEAGPIVLRSSNPAVISVEADGGLRSRAAGTAWITATYRGVSDSVLVTVLASGYPLTFLAGTETMSIAGVNDAGQVVGSVAGVGVLVSGDAHTDLGSCLPVAINNAGQIACRSAAVYWNGTVTAAPSTGSTMLATGITESGSVFGGQRNTGLVPFLWTADSVVAYPSVPLDGIGGVNSLGHGVGYSAATYHQPVMLTRAGARGLSAPGGRYATPSAINDADDIVGSSENQSGSGTAAIWRASEQWRGRILGQATGVAWGIAENGLVVGDAFNGAFVWQNDRYALLSGLVAEAGWTITSAKAVSRGGLIAAQGTHVSGKRGIVLITPTAAP